MPMARKQTPNKLDGERLHVTSTWRVMPNWADKGVQRSLLVFEKAR
jgi:hypothetical protein